MKRTLIPYYVSRAALSALFGWFFSLTMSLWVGVVAGIVVFAGFLWYAHSGRYLIDESTPLFPLRRDDRGKAIRDRSTVLAVVVTGLAFLGISLGVWASGAPSQLGWLAVVTGVVTYFVASNWLFVKN